LTSVAAGCKGAKGSGRCATETVRKGGLPVRSLLLFAILTVAAVPAGGQTPDRMAVMQYYVGSWNCSAVGEPDSKTIATYAIEHGVMRDSVVIPPQGKMTTAYQLELVTTFDPKNGRYVQTSLDSEASWKVSFAKPFTGSAEEWIDNVSSDGKLGRVQVVRNDNNNFDIIGYATVSQVKPYFKVSCHRS
jgi:hypothetical protein